MRIKALVAAGLLLIVLSSYTCLADTNNPASLTAYVILQSVDGITFEPMQFNGFPIDESPKWFVIADKSGNMLFQPIPFCITREGCESFWFDNTQYLIERFWYSDESGVCRTALIIEPTEVFTGFVFGEVFPFSEGRAPACRFGNSRGYGYIGVDGEFIIPDIWEWAESFSNGEAIVSYRTALGYRDLIINLYGEVIGIIE